VSVFDPSTPGGAGADARLRVDQAGWLTTVGPGGVPRSTPVWFLWDGDEILVYSRPRAPKVRAVAANPGVSFHLDGDRRGGEVVTVEGTARVDPSAPPADRVPAYVEKYASGIARLGTDPAGFAADYSAAIRITPTRGRAWGV
jgi:PPOX class probable F420-dependent enzyme